MSDKKVCAGCGNALRDNEGVKLWDTWFCSLCFIGNAAKIHRELTPEQVVLLRLMGKTLAGFMPPDLVEMIAVGFWRRITGRKDEPPVDELERFVGEIQRLAALSYFRREMNLLETWHSEFKNFVEARMDEIKETVKRLTDFDEKGR